MRWALTPGLSTAGRATEANSVLENPRMRFLTWPWRLLDQRIMLAEGHGNVTSVARESGGPRYECGLKINLG